MMKWGGDVVEFGNSTYSVCRLNFQIRPVRRPVKKRAQTGESIRFGDRPNLPSLARHQRQEKRSALRRRHPNRLGPLGKGHPHEIL